MVAKLIREKNKNFSLKKMIEIPLEEETLKILNNFMERLNLKNHNSVINFLIGVYFIKKSREE